ncbi:hypothetical protein BZA70DRAFT_313189 [Myxozyma melibiosi]|uniref:DUF7492 domain-containing protein n=1 Tax=Myxozyma melibiosi TaxID=54550 RepID=A0ABR1EXY1_9ASCO
MNQYLVSAICLLSVLRPCLAHSWIDILYATDPDTGTIRSTGYIRNYQGHIDLDETYHLLDPTAASAVCASNQQTATYSSEYPMLTARPGDNITAHYEENGHVTLDSLAPDYKPHPGYYAWLWTGEPGTELTTVGEMLEVDNVLAGPFTFDDGKCAVAEGNPFGAGRTVQPCVATFWLPYGLVSGTYSLVWAWHFPKIPACETGATLEFYTSCLDIYVDNS